MLFPRFCNSSRSGSILYICRPLFTVPYRTTMPVKAPSAASTWHHPCLCPSAPSSHVVYHDKVVTLIISATSSPSTYRYTSSWPPVPLLHFLCVPVATCIAQPVGAYGGERNSSGRYDELQPQVQHTGWGKSEGGRGYVEEPAARVPVVLMAGASMNIVPPGRRPRSLLAGHPKHRCYKPRTKRHRAPCRTTSNVPLS